MLFASGYGLYDTTQVSYDSLAKVPDVIVTITLVHVSTPPHHVLHNTPETCLRSHDECRRIAATRTILAQYQSVLDQSGVGCDRCQRNGRRERHHRRYLLTAPQ